MFYFWGRVSYLVSFLIFPTVPQLYFFRNFGVISSWASLVFWRVLGWMKVQKLPITMHQLFLPRKPQTHFFHLTPVCLLSSSSFPPPWTNWFVFPSHSSCTACGTPPPECEILFVLVFFFSSPTNSFESIAFDFKYVCVFFTYLAEIFRKINMKYNKFFMAIFVCGRQIYYKSPV